MCISQHAKMYGQMQPYTICLPYIIVTCITTHPLHVSHVNAGLSSTQIVLIAFSLMSQWECCSGVLCSSWQQSLPCFLLFRRLGLVVMASVLVTWCMRRSRVRIPQVPPYLECSQDGLHPMRLKGVIVVCPQKSRSPNMGMAGLGHACHMAAHKKQGFSE